MKPTTEKMTKPANIEVDEFTEQTISASLEVIRVTTVNTSRARKLNFYSLVHVVVVLVVAAEGDESSQAQTVREENLRHGIDPHVGLAELRQIGRDVELDALHGAGQCDASEQEDGQQDVGEQRGEIHDLAERRNRNYRRCRRRSTHLSSPSDALPDAEVAQNPHQQKGSGELPANVSDLLDAARNHQSATPLWPHEENAMERKRKRTGN